jgi:hypothetical protein
VDKNEGIINNWNSLGICCIGNFDEETMPILQFNSLVTLLKSLNRKYEILKTSIFKHSSLVATACPRKNFPFESTLQEVYMDPKIYPDVSEKDWYYKPVKFCKDKKFMNGDEFGFRPDDKVTRAELAATIYKVFHQEES